MYSYETHKYLFGILIFISTILDIIFSSFLVFKVLPSYYEVILIYLITLLTVLSVIWIIILIALKFQLNNHVKANIRAEEDIP